MAEPAPAPERRRPPRATRQRITRLIIGALALIYAIVLIALNRAKVRIHFLFFTVSTRLWVGFLVSLALGALLCQSLLAYRRRAARSHRPREGGPAT